MTEAGYRLYAEHDLLTLQHILALKYLGFSLQEIRQCLESGPKEVEEMLARQRRMLQDRRRRLDAILSALGSAEKRLSAGDYDAEAIIRVITVIQMQEKQEWVKNYFSDAQLQKMGELGAQSYSPEAREKLAARAWTEADQEQISAQWANIAAESQRLAAAGADPAGEEGQRLAKLHTDLIFAFTQGDPEISAGLSKFWENHNALPEEERPLASAVPASVVPGANDAGAQFLQRALVLYLVLYKDHQAQHLPT